MFDMYLLSMLMMLSYMTRLAKKHCLHRKCSQSYHWINNMTSDKCMTSLSSTWVTFVVQQELMS